MIMDIITETKLKYLKIQSKVCVSSYFQQRTIIFLLNVTHFGCSRRIDRRLKDLIKIRMGH